MASLLDRGELPAPTEPWRPATISLSGRLARVYGYASLVGPALFTGATEQGLAMLELAIACCRDGDPGADAESLEVIGRALTAARTLMESEEGRRPAIDLVYRSIVRAATELPDP
jgi:hypothetical protein